MKGVHHNFLLLADQDRFLHYDIFQGSCRSDDVATFFTDAGVGTRGSVRACVCFAPVTYGVP